MKRIYDGAIEVFLCASGVWSVYKSNKNVTLTNMFERTVFLVIVRMFL